MKKTIAIFTMLIAFSLFTGNVSFAGVDSSPTFKESKNKNDKAIFETTIASEVVVTITARPLFTLELTPVAENSATLYVESADKQEAPVTVEATLLLYNSGDGNNTHIKDTRQPINAEIAYTSTAESTG